MKHTANSSFCCCSRLFSSVSVTTSFERLSSSFSASERFDATSVLRRSFFL